MQPLVLNKVFIPLWLCCIFSRNTKSELRPDSISAYYGVCLLAQNNVMFDEIVSNRLRINMLHVS